MAPASAMQREAISAALALLVVVAAAVSLLRMLLLSVRRLAAALLTATCDEGRQAVNIAVVSGRATLRLRPVLLFARGIELGVAR